jgi:hypothetical protein
MPDVGHPQLFWNKMLFTVFKAWNTGVGGVWSLWGKGILLLRDDVIFGRCMEFGHLKSHFFVL